MMKLNIDEKRFLAALDREGNHEIGAGILAADPVTAQPSEERVLVEGPRVDSTHLAFGRLIQLLRRQKGWSVEALASQARIDMEEAVLIEAVAEYRPEQRTVFQLAHVFNLQPKVLMQLSGNALPREDVTREALRFAASSEPIAKLSADETRAVETFVAALNRVADKESSVP
jgi:transcriptional regulator with XRE-family HTH domain